MSINVMVADDESVNRKLVGIILRKMPECGTVSMSEDGRQLLDQVATDPDDVNLIISDIMMPGMTGPKAVSRVFTETRANACVVFISGGDLGDGDKTTLKELLLDERLLGIIPKPFVMKDIQAAFYASDSTGDEARREASRLRLNDLTRDAAGCILGCSVRDLPTRFQQPEPVDLESL